MARSTQRSNRLHPTPIRIVKHYKRFVRQIAKNTESRAKVGPASLRKHKKSHTALRRLNSFGNAHSVDVSNFFESDAESVCSGFESCESGFGPGQVPFSRTVSSESGYGSNNTEREVVDNGWTSLRRPKKQIASLKRSKSEVSSKFVALPVIGKSDEKQCKENENDARTYGRRIFLVNKTGFVESACAQFGYSDMDVRPPPEIRIEHDGSEDDGNWSLAESVER